jgi:hypothetical protein
MMRGFFLVFTVDAAIAPGGRISRSRRTPTRGLSSKAAQPTTKGMTMTYTQTAPTTTDADISVERRSATTASEEYPAMTTVTERDTVNDAGSQLTDGYHMVMFSTAAAAVPSRPATITRRLIDAIRVVGATLLRPPRADTARGARATSSVRAWHAKCTDYE